MKFIKRLKPHFIYKNNLVCSKNNEIYFLNKHFEKDLITKLKISFINKILFKSKYLSRLLRIGIRASVYHKNMFFFSYKKLLYSYNLDQKKTSVEHIFRKGRGPLNYTNIEGLNNFEDGLIFGEYFSNPLRDEVNIYRRESSGKWEIIHTFKKNIINHIHSIVVDRYRDCLWVLAGDFDHSSSIWKIENNFKTVKRILYGKQIYRACFAYPTKEGLIYATDTQLHENSIRFLRIDNDTITSEELHKINGSGIYACELKDYLVFSTSTEPRHSNSKIVSLIDNKPGDGNIKNKSDLVLLNKKDYSFKIISSFDKDILPYGLFGLGTIMFSNGLEKENRLFAFLSGSKEHDQDLLFFNL